MIIDELITDRTQADVDYVNTLTAKWLDGSITAQEKTAWYDGLKGAYNFTDLNRIGGAVDYVADILNQSGRSITVTAKQDWTVADIPTQTQMSAFLSDLQFLKNSVSGIMIQIPSTMNNLDFRTANQIEQLIIAVYNAINRERANFDVCGIAICGVEGAL